MAKGQVTIFDDARAYMFDADWASTDVIKLAILDNTVAPTKSDAAPELADYTQVVDTGTYTDGGWTLDDWATMVSQSGGVMKFDSADEPTWAADGSNDNDAYWGYIYNATQSGGPGICFIDLGGPVDMSTIPLTITFNASGIFTI